MTFMSYRLASAAIVVASVSPFTDVSAARLRGTPAKSDWNEKNRAFAERLKQANERTRELVREKKEQPRRRALPESDSSSSDSDSSSEAESGSDAAPALPAGQAYYTRDDVAKHTTKHDCRVVVDGKVVNANEFLPGEAREKVARKKKAAAEKEAQEEKLGCLNTAREFESEAVAGKSTTPPRPTSVPIPSDSEKAERYKHVQEEVWPAELAFVEEGGALLHDEYVDRFLEAQKNFQENKKRDNAWNRDGEVEGEAKKAEEHEKISFTPGFMNARKEAQEKQRREYEERARIEAEDKARREAEERTQKEAEERERPRRIRNTIPDDSSSSSDSSCGSESSSSSDSATGDGKGSAVSRECCGRQHADEAEAGEKKEAQATKKLVARTPRPPSDSEGSEDDDDDSDSSQTDAGEGGALKDKGAKTEVRRVDGFTGRRQGLGQGEQKKNNRRRTLPDSSSDDDSDSDGESDADTLPQ